MPHLQEKTEEIHGRSNEKSSMPPHSDLLITEAKEGFLDATEGLLTIKGMNSQAPSNATLRSVSEDSTATPNHHHHGPKQSVITPSPFGSSEYACPKFGPIMTIFGNKKLVPSPIRVKRRVSHSEDDDNDVEGTTGMAQPTNLRYVDGYTTPTKAAVPNHAGSLDTDEHPKKRLLGQLEKDESVAKKSRMVEEEYDEERRVEDGYESPETKAVITPASSGEKGNEEDGAPTGGPPGGAYPPYGHHHGMAYPQQYPGYPPRRHPYGAPPPPGYGQPPFAGGYPMYNGYPPPPPAHFMGRPGAPMGAPYYPPYPAHNPAMMRQYPPRAVPPQPFPASSSTPQRMMGRPSGPPREMADPAPSQDLAAIQSVAEWRQAALANGKPPSANRCVPLKEPIPSKYWGWVYYVYVSRTLISIMHLHSAVFATANRNAEKTKDAVLPDFHRLVNYPDYLVKSRNSSASDPSQADAGGKRNCVMCGQLRVCSAASYVGRGRNVAKPVEVTSSCSSSVDDDCAAHIIPRQNKGLCTACDVTVWVVVTDGLEIKWCKGCKNFRPWAAFGDKGSATKCVRCRDRQREKYAMQKDEIRHRKVKRSASSTSSIQSESVSPSPSMDGGAADNESTHLAAARGLHNLINAANV